MLPDRLALFNRAHIPARHANSSFESFSIKLNPQAVYAFEHARRWAESYRTDQENRGLVLCGDIGRGKTHLMIAILRHLALQKGVELRFVEFSHLLSELKAGFDEGVGESGTLGPLIRIPVLAIDELGRGRGTEWEKTIIDALVSHRYNALATILATTNFSPVRASAMAEANLAVPGFVPTLGDRIGDRVFSRLKETCTFMTVSGEDCRVKLSEQPFVATARKAPE